jgi:signal transduction histidine kinase
VLFVSIILIFRFTSKNLSGAVNNLVNAASKIARNEFDEPVIAQNQDELGFLAESFDKMRLTLKDNLQKLAEAQDERIRSERLATIGQIAAGIIHDFKSPMTVIKMSSEILESNMYDKSQKKYTQKINSQVDRMVNMAQDILDYSHGKKSLNLTKVEFTEAIANKIKFQQKRFEEKKIDLKIITPPPFKVYIDTNKFTRVLDNLLINAYEALEPGDKVDICIKRNDDNFQILISDNGPGIPEDIVETLFLPFVTSGKLKGTGLGLAITSKIIEDHGGDISVKSEKNYGTTFTITLPNSVLNKDKIQKKVGPIHEN